ncbi:hypothetical protein GE061_003927 [Apolygus lucorum]|uniref:SWIM-type domain-containing protein n=1 Tax=Apolygus lucorum TaxID=248454 RepID=A0A8S9X0F4_APOLU|nr:hypothetical protein GE061_003927 [Apolygus lucorum]
MLITRKHLHNVAKEFGIRRDKDGRFHGKDEIHDAVSVEQWVRKNVASDAICVRYCKFQGEIDCDHAELRSDDFVLILMSNVQVEMLKLFGNIVCVDGTHGTNGYGSDITTVLVLNGHNEGFPVATMFSNRSDSQTISIFFSYIQKLCGEINCNVFMTDTTELYFRAWCKTIGTPVHRFFCSWHVEKDWKKNLNKVEGDQSLKILVYEKIRMTQMESNVYAFRRMFDTLMSDLLGNAKTRNFGEYVHDRYTNSTRNWAFCYRRSAGINSSTHVERMHGIFRHFYVQGKKIKRLDKAIYALEAFIRSKLSEAVPQRGILTRKLQTLHRNHTIFQKENERMKVLQLHDGEWVVISATQFELFNVLQVRRSCDDCFMKCDLCEVCCHSHVCTCTDSSIRGNMCKHIHKVCFETNNYDYAEGPTVELANDGFYEESDNESAECVIRGSRAESMNDGEHVELNQLKTAELLHAVQNYPGLAGYLTDDQYDPMGPEDANNMIVENYVANSVLIQQHSPSELPNSTVPSAPLPTGTHPCLEDFEGEYGFTVSQEALNATGTSHSWSYSETLKQVFIKMKTS